MLTWWTLSNLRLSSTQLEVKDKIMTWFKFCWSAKHKLITLLSQVNFHFTLPQKRVMIELFNYCSTTKQIPNCKEKIQIPRYTLLLKKDTASLFRQLLILLKSKVCFKKFCFWRTRKRRLHSTLQKICTQSNQMRTDKKFLTYCWKSRKVWKLKLTVFKKTYLQVKSNMQLKLKLKQTGLVCSKVEHQKTRKNMANLEISKIS